LESRIRSGANMSFKYFPGQHLTINGFALNVSATGTVYYKSPLGYIKLNSLFQGKINLFTIDLPDGTTGELKISEGKLVLIEEKEKK